jgi:hypothetical protein
MIFKGKRRYLIKLYSPWIKVVVVAGVVDTIVAFVNKECDQSNGLHSFKAFKLQKNE